MRGYRVWGLGKKPASTEAATSPADSPNPYTLNPTPYTLDSTPPEGLSERAALIGVQCLAGLDPGRAESPQRIFADASRVERTGAVRILTVFEQLRDRCSAR